jgi:hypothetical protein
MMLIVFCVARQVNGRWLTDLDVFNEWMNEEDYEITDSLSLMVLYFLASYNMKVVQILT